MSFAKTVLVAFVVLLGACSSNEPGVGTAQQIVAPTVAANQPISAGDLVSLTWTGMPGNAHDYIAVANQGAASDQVVVWTYINSQVGGSYSFNPLPAGDYEARAYLDDSYTILAFSDFTIGTASCGDGTCNVGETCSNCPADCGVCVGCGNGTCDGGETCATCPSDCGACTSVTIAPDQSTYLAAEYETMTWSGMPGNPHDWVAIATAGSAPDQGIVAWTYMNSQTSGSFAFNPLPPGGYEVRAYINDTYAIAATSTFIVTNATLSTDQLGYGADQYETTTWTGMPGNLHDWVAIATAGAPSDQGIVTWTYMNSQTSGSFAFNPLPPGDYEARAFVNDTYTLIASADFSVSATVAVCGDAVCNGGETCTSCPTDCGACASVMTDQTAYQVGSPETATWVSAPGNAHDYIAIATAGSPPDQGIVAWTYLNSQANGSFTFNALPAGSYEARVYLNDTYTILAFSTFTIN